MKNKDSHNEWERKFWLKEQPEDFQSENKRQWELENKGNTKVKNEDQIIDTIYFQKFNSEKKLIMARIDILKGNSDLNKELKKEYYALGKKAYKIKNYYHAIEHYSNALKYNSESPKFDAKLYYSRGLTKTKIDDYEGAISDFYKTIELDPGHHSAYWWKRDTLIKMNKWPD